MESSYKKKISASITLQLNHYVNFNNYKSITGEEVYNDWLEISTIEINNNRYYVNKGVPLESYALDDELLKDLKNEFINRMEKVVEKTSKKLSTEKATDKQIKYANKLHRKIYNKDGIYNADDYTKEEIGVVINKLLEEEKTKPSEPRKVIGLFE